MVFGEKERYAKNLFGGMRLTGKLPFPLNGEKSGGQVKYDFTNSNFTIITIAYF